MHYDKCMVASLKLYHLLCADILRIENLWQFTNLRKLQLDNNIIEEVCGLENLTQLEWLDLSFNNIEVISGLDKLNKLKDLSLANNHIQTIENLDSLCDCLQVLSLANNLIDGLKNVSSKSHYGEDDSTTPFVFRIQMLEYFPGSHNSH